MQRADLPGRERGTRSHRLHVSARIRLLSERQVRTTGFGRVWLDDDGILARLSPEPSRDPMKPRQILIGLGVLLAILLVWQISKPIPTTGNWQKALAIL